MILSTLSVTGPDQPAKGGGARASTLPPTVWLESPKVAPAAGMQTGAVRTCGPVTLAPPEDWPFEFANSEPLL